MSKLIICGLTLGKGGTERVISVLSKELLKFFSEVEILLYYDKEICYEIDSHVKITIVEKHTNTTNILINVLWIRYYLKEQNAIILSFMSSNNVMILAATAGIKNKVVVSERSDPYVVPENVFIRYIRDKIYRYADAVVCQTNNAKEYFENKSSIKKCIVIPNPTSVPYDKKGLALKTNKEDAIVCVGRLIESKNYEMTLQVFKDFIKDHKSYKLKIFGDGNIVYKTKLLNLINDMGLNKKVVLLGNSNQIFEDISSSKIYLSTSNVEGMSNALIEAMCLGLPVVVSKTLGVPDLIKFGVNGLYFDINDRNKCLNMLYKLADDIEYSKKIANEAVKLNNDLNKEKVVKKWVEVLRGV